MIMSVKFGIEELARCERCSETRILGIVWMGENIVEQITETQTAWTTYAMAVRNHGRLVSLLRGRCMRTLIRMIEMISLLEDTWMKRETDIDRLLTFNRKEDQNHLHVTRTIFSLVRA
jgi:hypothetical protein